MGSFPTAFKTGLVKPLLKKSDLDTNDFRNCRPISNHPERQKLELCQRPGIQILVLKEILKGLQKLILSSEEHC